MLDKSGTRTTPVAGSKVDLHLLLMNAVCWYMHLGKAFPASLLTGASRYTPEDCVYIIAALRY